MHSIYNICGMYSLYSIYSTICSESRLVIKRFKATGQNVQRFMMTLPSSTTFIVSQREQGWLYQDIDKHFQTFLNLFYIELGKFIMVY